MILLPSISSEQLRWFQRAPLLALLHPRAHTVPLLALLALGVTLGSIGVLARGWALWQATTLTLALLLLPAIRKWRDDERRWGEPFMVLSILLALQGFHGLEHLAQWVEYHLLGWPPRQASGLLSAANAELVHFAWNWSVCAVALYLQAAPETRTRWGWLLLGWALAHSLEHTYLFIRYLAQIQLLDAQGASLTFAQGQPGILGRHGWLASSPTTRGTWLCALPILTTVPRLDIHFGWNVGETLLLLLAGHRAMADRLQREPIAAWARSAQGSGVRGQGPGC